MNTKQLIIAAAMLAATGSALAKNSEYPVPDEGFVSTKTRAQVQAELAQTGPQGVLAQSQEWNYPAVVLSAGPALKAEAQADNDTSSADMMEHCTKMMS
jgi:hypothetical protein